MENARRILLPVFVLWLMLLPAAPAPASIPAETPYLFLIDTGKVKDILKSDLILLDNNKRYKLDNIRVPPFEDAAAVKGLKHAWLDRKVNIYTYRNNSGETLDRYGVPLAHVVSDDASDVWMQAYMVSEGLAWAFSSETSRGMVPPLKKMEIDARTQQKGFWKNPVYAIKTPADAKAFINSFQLVEGTILDTSIKREYVFFNFGQDWKTDFTIRLPKKAWNQISLALVDKKFNAFDAVAWVNRRVRVRGWIEDSNGPLIEVTHLEQIDILPQPKKE
jgi:hypothetical protein